jgi:histidinol-phosphate aminotransferase
MHTERKNHANIYLDRNESQFGPAPECFSILRRATKNELSNYSRDFARGVKSVLSETLASEYDIPETNILLSYGSEDMLKQIVHCYLAKDEVIMIPQHSWWYYKSVASEVSGTVVEYPMHANNERYTYDLGEIISLVRFVKPRLLLFASPNNPTGNSLSMDDVKLLVNECTDTMVVIDEAYFGFTDISHNIMPQLTLHYPHLAVLRTFSKLYALAGIRIGYAFVGKNYQKLITFSARYLGYNVLSEELALAALRDKKYYQSLAATMATERERYYQFFRTVEGCTAYRTDANFVLVKLPHEDCDSLKKPLAEAGLVIKFFAEKEFPDHVRITIGTPEQNSLLLNEMKKYFARKSALVTKQG